MSIFNPVASHPGFGFVSGVRVLDGLGEQLFAGQFQGLNGWLLTDVRFVRNSKQVVKILPAHWGKPFGRGLGCWMDDVSGSARMKKSKA